MLPGPQHKLGYHVNICKNVIISNEQLWLSWIKSLQMSLDLRCGWKHICEPDTGMKTFFSFWYLMIQENQYYYLIFTNIWLSEWK